MSSRGAAPCRCGALSLALAALAGSLFARTQLDHRYRIPARCWTLEPRPEPEPQQQQRPPVIHRASDSSAAARVAAAIDAIADGAEDLAIGILLDLEADLEAFA
jgi:hypothetical protein